MVKIVALGIPFCPVFVVGIAMNGEGSEAMQVEKEMLVYMWGYLPGALPQRTPLLTPVLVRVPPSGYSWSDVCGGGCGFAMAISGTYLYFFLLVIFLYELEIEEASFSLFFWYMYKELLHRYIRVFSFYFNGVRIKI